MGLIHNIEKNINFETKYLFVIPLINKEKDKLKIRINNKKKSKNRKKVIKYSLKNIKNYFIHQF